MSIVLWLAACGGGGTWSGGRTPAATLAPPAIFGACAGPSAGNADTEPLWEGIAVALDGVVLAGPPDDTAREACADTEAVSSREVAWDAATWIAATDLDGAAWTVGLVLPEDPGFRTDEPVAVTWSYQRGGFSPDLAAFEIRDDASALRAWIGVGGELSDLAPPEGLTLARGPTVAEEEDDCVSWASFDLEVSLGSDTVDLAYGDTAAIGGLAVWHGGYDEGSASRCPDAYVAHAAVAAAGL
jgi:hypothetical protein